MYPQGNFYYPQTPQQQPMYNSYQTMSTPTGLRGRPVASFEEARAMTIDFDGSTFFFPDLANKRIYTKQINMDGTASLFVYELREQPIEPVLPNNANYITREEFDKVMNELRASMVKPVQPIAAPAPTVKPEVKNYNNMF